MIGIAEADTQPQSVLRFNLAEDIVTLFHKRDTDHLVFVTQGHDRYMFSLHSLAINIILRLHNQQSPKISQVSMQGMSSIRHNGHFNILGPEPYSRVLF